MTVEADASEIRHPTAHYHRLSRSGAGLADALRSAASSLIAYRWQIVQSFKRDFASLSNMTRWGAVWNFILPLAPLGVYVMLTSLRVFPKFGGVEAAVYITMGVTLWFLFSGLLRTPISTLESDFKTLARMNMPVFPAIISGYSQLAFDTCLRLVVVAIVFALMQGAPSWKLVYAPIFAILGSILFAGLGLILALFNLAYRDISKLIGVALTYGIFFSGVIFPLSGLPYIDYILAANPFYVFIENIRVATIGGAIEYPAALAFFSVAGMFLFAFAVVFAHRAELRLRGLV
ncbi:MAG: ABC transporter permease [Parvularculaceae bacterium]